MQFEENSTSKEESTSVGKIKGKAVNKTKKPDRYGNKPLPISNRPFFELMGYTIHKERTTRISSIVAWVFAVICIFWAITTSKDLKVVPFVILKDSLGNLTPLGIATGQNNPDFKADQRVVVSELSKYIKDLHTITSNQQLMLDDIKTMIAMTAPTTQQKAKTILSTQYQSSQGYDVIVTPTQIMPNTGVKNGWKITWKETKYTLISDQSTGEVSYWEATLTFDFAQQKSNDTELLTRNPLGIQIMDLNINKVMSNDAQDSLSNAVIRGNQPVQNTENQQQYQSMPQSGTPPAQSQQQPVPAAQ